MGDGGLGKCSAIQQVAALAAAEAVKWTEFVEEGLENVIWRDVGTTMPELIAVLEEEG